MAPRYFSLERLLSIYSQLVGHVEGRRALGYGTVSIYATVGALRTCSIHKVLTKMCAHITASCR